MFSRRLKFERCDWPTVVLETQLVPGYHYQKEATCGERGVVFRSNCYLGRPVKILLALASARRFESTLVETEEDGKIFFVSIARSEKRNAVNAETAKQLSEAFRAFENHDECSVAVFFGKGGSFCSGYDLQEWSERDPEKFLKSVPPVGEGDAPLVSKSFAKSSSFFRESKTSLQSIKTFHFQKTYEIKVFVPFFTAFSFAHDSVYRCNCICLPVDGPSCFFARQVPCTVVF